MSSLSFLDSIRSLGGLDGRWGKPNVPEYKPLVVGGRDIPLSSASKRYGNPLEGLQGPADASLAASDISPTARRYGNTASDMLGRMRTKAMIEGLYGPKVPQLTPTQKQTQANVEMGQLETTLPRPPDVPVGNGDFMPAPLTSYVTGTVGKPGQPGYKEFDKSSVILPRPGLERDRWPEYGSAEQGRIAGQNMARERQDFAERAPNRQVFQMRQDAAREIESLHADMSPGASADDIRELEAEIASIKRDFENASGEHWLKPKPAEDFAQALMRRQMEQDGSQ